MQVIVAGSRTIEDYEAVETAINASGFTVDLLISGACGGIDDEGLARTGVDRMGELWARAHDVPIRQFPADWARLGKAAGHKRNALMAYHADAVVVVWDGSSPGSANMLEIARKRKLPVFEKVLD